MNRPFLDFEQPIADLQAKIAELRMMGSDAGINISDEVLRLEKKCEVLTQTIFSKVDAPKVVKLARHPARPRTLDYIQHIFTDFDELHGDRHFSAGHTIVGGLATLDKQPVMVMGHQKGNNTKENLQRNFGMARPEDYRKALRLMKLAEKFELPIFTFIDTAGAYPGIGAEERNQSEAIARNLFEMATLKTPILCTVIGEGGSGGALAIGVGDVTLMLQYSIYSVISPEGCASILWKSDEKASIAAEALGITADRLHALGLIDEIVPEPLGGAHRDRAMIFQQLKTSFLRHLEQLKMMSIDDRLEQRYQRLMAMGTWNEH